MPQSGAFRAADLVLDPRLGAVAGFEELDLPAGGAGGGDLVALAFVLLEQGQLRAGCGFSRRIRIRMSAGQPARRSPPAQQPGQLGDLRVRSRRPVCVQGRGRACSGSRGRTARIRSPKSNPAE
jgi:hypothetical protein